MTKRESPHLAPFLLLPQELKDLIAQYCSPWDLSNLSRTCAAVRVAMLPALYYEINFQLETPQCELLQQSLSLPELSKLVKVLVVKLTGDSEQSLCDIVGLCPQLKKLICDYHLDHINGLGFYECIDETVVSAAVESVQDSLTCLVVRYRCNAKKEWAHPCTEEALSLRKLSSLTELDISFYLLLGWYPKIAPKLANVLPRNLVKLTLNEDMHWNSAAQWETKDVVSALTEFIEDWREITPFLEEISFEGGTDYVPHNVLQDVWRAEREFQELCRRNGLICNVCQFPAKPYHEHYRYPM